MSSGRATSRRSHFFMTARQSTARSDPFGTVTKPLRQGKQRHSLPLVLRSKSYQLEKSPTKTTLTMMTSHPTPPKIAKADLAPTLKDLVDKAKKLYIIMVKLTVKQRCNRYQLIIPESCQKALSQRKFIRSLIRTV